MKRTRHLVFFHLCSCKGKQITDPVVKTSCYNHLYEDDSLEQIVIKQLRNQKNVPAELIDLGWNGETAKHPIDVTISERFWRSFEVREGVMTAADVRKIVIFVSSDEADPCVCCGKKQSKHAEVSLSQREWRSSH